MKNKIMRYEPMFYEQRVECAKRIINDISIYRLWECVATPREADLILRVMEVRSEKCFSLSRTIKAMLGYGFDRNEACEDEEDAFFTDALFAVRAFLDLYSACEYVDGGWYRSSFDRELRDHFPAKGEFMPVTASVEDIERRIFEREPTTKAEDLLLRLVEDDYALLETVHLNGLDDQ